MASITDGTAKRKAIPRWLSCLGCATGLPLALLAVLAAVFAVNNRPPDIFVPTPPPPPVNAYDDFVRAANMIRGIKHKSPASMVGTVPKSQRSEEHTSELQSRLHLVCRLLLEKKKKT